MPSNSYLFLLTGFIPLIFGAIYFHKRVLGTAWKKASGLTVEDLQRGNMFVILIAAYIFSCLLSFFLSGLVVHQPNVFQLMIPEILEEGSSAQSLFKEIMSTYGEKHRSFKHGAIHGLITGMLFSFPLIAVIGLFEHRGWRYIFIHSFYWLLNFVVIGGILCQYLIYPSL